MTEDDDNDEREDDGNNGTTVAAGVNNHRKRRLSKRERKNLKRSRPVVVGLDVGGGRREEQGGAIDASSDDAVPASSSAAHPSSTAPAAESSSPSYRTDEFESGWTTEEYMAEYVPTPKPPRGGGGGDGDDASDNDDVNNNNNNNDNNSKSLGRWFPKASVIKSSVCYSNDYLAKIAKARKSRMRKEEKYDDDEDENATEEEEPKASLVLFYQYVSPPWSPAKVTALLSYLAAIAGHRTHIGGRIRVSSEGVNATVSAASSSSSSSSSDGGGRPASFRAAAALRHFAEDLRRFDPRSFAPTDFKYVDGLSADRHFKELKLIPVKELVFYGMREDDVAVVAGGKGGGVHLDPRDYHEMLKRDDAVVIDVRNHYEAAIGRFEGQMTGWGDRGGGGEAGRIEDGDGGGGDDGGARCGGARYIDPKMRKSTDFTSWLAEPETRQKLEGKTVLMFCTGGIRCERASAYLNSRMGSDLKGVYQLKGGVERYLQSFPDGGFWRGKNFVFDKREAIGPGNVNGYGLSSAAVGKNAAAAAGGGKGKGGGKDDDGKSLSWGTECAGCRKPWDRYIGKRKCHTCGVPVLVCDACMSRSTSSAQKKKKGRRKKKNAKEEGEEEAAQSAEKDASGAVEAVDVGPRREEGERIRCPLCIEEGVTVPAEEVEYTDNGVRGKLRSSSFAEDGGFDEDSGAAAATCKPAKAKDDDARKAARSVCKWGGGHAARKKEKRKFSRRPCQFGSDCARKDCFFYHPE